MKGRTAPLADEFWRAYEFTKDAKITRQVQLFNQWSLVQQAADQMTGLIGPLFRWFVRSADAEMRKGLPANT